jgi:hypothetical protein
MWYDSTMETLVIGSLFKPRESTVCWKERDGTLPRDLPVGSGDFLILCDGNTLEVIPGLHTVKVLHPKYGMVTCILDELMLVKQNQTN